MGWNENLPKKSGGDFSSVNAKTNYAPFRFISLRCKVSIVTVTDTNYYDEDR
jgi:hypothetical protein